MVLVSPDGPLNYLPFASLPGKSKNKFLVHEYAFGIVTVPVLLRDIVARNRTRLEAPNFLLVGGVEFGSPGTTIPPSRLPAIPQNWQQLAWTGSEVNDLAAQFTQAFPMAHRPDPLRDKLATKEAFTAALPGSTYVHLATHGFFADENEVSAVDTRAAPNPIRLNQFVSGRNPGLLSGVVFAAINNPPRGAVESCLLTALEASELDLRDCELITLSACDTGRGRVAGGEGVLGLQRAFSVAGARAVLASQWKIPEAPTHALMREFYKQLWANDRPGIAKALQHAQLWIIEHPDDIRSATEPKNDPGPLSPYYWAAFTVAGDWR